MMLLNSCCKVQTSNVPTHRLQTIEKPKCAKETYKDVVECLILYNGALEQANSDKEAVRDIINKAGNI